MAKNNGPQKEKPSWEGHRGRLRKRFLEGGLRGFGLKKRERILFGLVEKLKTAQF